MTRNLRTTTLCILIIAFCLPGCEEKPRSRQRAPGPEALIGSQVPEIAADDLQGKPLKLSDYRGRVIVLSFWAEY